MKDKYKKTLLSLVIGNLLYGCSYSYYKYTQENENIYKFSNGLEMIESKLAPLIYDIENPKEIKLSFGFSENLIKAKNLKSIELKLFYKEGNDSKYIKEIPIIKSNINVEYWNEKTIVKKTKDNYSEDLFLLIDDSMNDVKYKDSKIVRFVLENTYKTDTLPETLEQKIKIQWKDKEPTIYTNILTKKKITKDFISGRPFG